MSEARCPLVREIEEASKRCLAAGPASDNAQDPLPWTEAEWDADQIVASEAWWPRLRAALEAAEEMAQYAEAMEADIGCPPAVADWLKRYRAATRTEGTG